MPYHLCAHEQVVLPIPHLRSVNPTASPQNPAERYIQVVSVDNHEFWFMGFVNYDSAVKNLQEAVRGVHGVWRSPGYLNTCLCGMPYAPCKAVNVFMPGACIVVNLVLRCVPLDIIMQCIHVSVACWYCWRSVCKYGMKLIEIWSQCC